MNNFNLPASYEELAYLSQAIALLAAGTFFAARFLSGWFYTNLNLNIEIERKPNTTENNHDHAVVNVTLEKGDRSTARIDSLIIRAFTLDNGAVPFAERSPDVKHSLRPHNLNLPPGEVAKFAVHFFVPRDSVCSFQAEVRSKKANWKCSAISLTLEKTPNKSLNQIGR